MLRHSRVFLPVIVVLSLVAGAMGAASIGVPERAGATAVISSPANNALFETNTIISLDGSRSTGSQGHNTTNPIIAWEWTFGDGSNASGSMVLHAYDKAGGFQVTLIVTDSANATGMASIAVYLAPPAGPQNLPNQPTGGGAFNPASAGAMVLSLAGPSAVISSPANSALFELGNVVFFDGSRSTGTSTPNGSYPLVSWQWSLGDGTNTSGVSVNYSYTTAGYYHVTLIVRDSQGATGMASVAVYLSPPARPQNLPSQPQGGGSFNPVSGGGFILSLGGATAVISSPANGTLFGTGENILFDGSRSTGSSIQNTSYPIVAWNWSFGDGGIGAGTTIVHSYSAAGSYTVTLTVTDSNGASAFTTIKVVISPPPTPQNIPSQPGGGSNFNPALGGMGFV